MGVLLFLVWGVLAAAALVHWSLGTPMRLAHPYTFTVMLSQVHLGRRGAGRGGAVWDGAVLALAVCRAASAPGGGRGAGEGGG